MAGIEVNVDPIAEWKQMYHEVWRIERSYFYDPNLHGVNTADSEKEYEKYLDSLSSRSDLNYIFKDMLSEMTSGHLRGGGGNIPLARTVPGGLLGADYEVVNGHYRFKKIYVGESWNPQLQAPLAQPGLNVNEGDYLLAVNGRELTGKDDVSRLLENTAGKPVILKIGADPSGANSREITVVPIASELQLRHAEWIAANRRKVDQLSGGKLAYVYLPDTGQGGLTNFNRYYYAQSDKQGAVIDERFNSGGQVADYIIEAMRRQLMGFWSPRYGAIYRTPAASIQGPKVMIINEMAGSGGDMMPWMFRYTKLGPLRRQAYLGRTDRRLAVSDAHGRRQRDLAKLRLLQPGGRLGCREPRCRAGCGDRDGPETGGRGSRSAARTRRRDDAPIAGEESSLQCRSAPNSRITSARRNLRQAGLPADGRSP